MEEGTTLQAPEEEVEEWLHEEMTFIRQKAGVHRGRFNFAFLAEKAFGHPFHRETFRFFALHHGFHHAMPKEKKKLYVRFETPGPGFLFQHDSSRHQWIPGLGVISSSFLPRTIIPGFL